MFHCSVREMLARVDQRELWEWVAYFQYKHERANPPPDPREQALEAQRSQVIEEQY